MERDQITRDSNYLEPLIAAYQKNKIGHVSRNSSRKPKDFVRTYIKKRRTNQIYVNLIVIVRQVLDFGAKFTYPFD